MQQKNFDGGGGLDAGEKICDSIWNLGQTIETAVSNVSSSDD